MDATTLDIKTLPTKRLAAIRHQGPYNTVGQAFGQLGRLAGPAGLFGAPGAMMVGVYYDDPDTTAPDALHSAAGIVVADGVKLPAGLEDLRMDGGRFACVTHAGPYETLPNTWKQAKEAIKAGGHRPRAAASYEIYLNDPSRVPPSELKTEICLPIE